MIPTLWLIRGLPGSGKSTTALKLCKNNPLAVHCEADMYFTHGDAYAFDPSKLADAHAWCFEQARVALIQGKDAAVSNTFTTQQEAQPYIDFAHSLGANIEVITCTSTYESIHNVPQHTLEKMRARFAPTITY